MNSAGPNSAAAPSRIGAIGFNARSAARSSFEAQRTFGGGNEVALGDHETVRDRDLARALAAPAQSLIAIDRVDHRRHAGEREALAKGRVAEQRVQDRRRLGDAGGFENDPVERRKRARFAPRQNVAERVDQVAAQGATDAAAADQDRVAAEPLIQKMIEADLADLVDDDERIGKFARSQQAIDERGFACAEKARDDVEGDPRLLARLTAGEAALLFVPCNNSLNLCFFKRTL